MEAQQNQEVNQQHHEHGAQPGFIARAESNGMQARQSLSGFPFEKPSQSLCTKNAPYYESIFI